MESRSYNNLQYIFFVILIMATIFSWNVQADNKMGTSGRLLKGTVSLSPNIDSTRRSLFPISSQFPLACSFQACGGVTDSCCLLTTCQSFWILGSFCVPSQIPGVQFSLNSSYNIDSSHVAQSPKSLVVPPIDAVHVMHGHEQHVRAPQIFNINSLNLAQSPESN